MNPTELSGNITSYQTDANGNIIYKADGTPAKKRGRKPGSTSGPSATSTKPRDNTARVGAFNTTQAIGMLAAQFQMLNTGIAFLTDFEDFKLDDKEAIQMATAAANVLEQFEYTPDPKVAAVIGLVTTTSMIYGPRVYLYRQQLKKKAKAKKDAQTIRSDNAAATGWDDATIPGIDPNFTFGGGNLN